MPARTTAVGSRRLAVALGVVLLTTSGCGLFGGDGDFEAGSVLTMAPEQCFQQPEDVEAQVERLEPVDCADPHDREVYAVVDYEPVDPEADADVFPGDDALRGFADGRCAQEFEPYVGISYLDSPDLFFTYLLPSPRSWETGDRRVICFVFAAGRQLTGSVRGTGAPDDSDGPEG